MLYFAHGDSFCDSSGSDFNPGDSCAYILRVEFNTTSSRLEVKKYAGVGSPGYSFFEAHYESYNGRTDNPRDNTDKLNTAMTPHSITFRSNGDLYYYDSTSYRIRVIIHDTGKIYAYRCVMRSFRFD